MFVRARNRQKILFSALFCGSIGRNWEGIGNFLEACEFHAWQKCSKINISISHLLFQWVPFILVLQACSFYVPHLLWQSFNWITGYQIRAVVSAAKQASAQPIAESRPTLRKIGRSLFHASQLRHRTLRIVREFVDNQMKWESQLSNCLDNNS